MTSLKNCKLGDPKSKIIYSKCLIDISKLALKPSLKTLSMESIGTLKSVTLLTSLTIKAILLSLIMLMLILI